MEIIINSKGVHMGDSFKTYINEHMTSLMSKYFKETHEIHISLLKDRQLVTADLSAHIGRGLTLRSHGDSLDPYAAFDLAYHKIETRLRRYKNRIQDHHLHHGEDAAEEAPQYILSYDVGMNEDGLDDASSAVIAELIQEIPFLSVSDAVMRMDLSDVPVLIFKNKTHGGLNVVHRRPDGNIGWIDPDGIRECRKITS